ncbi:dipeptide ABC transporter ATP-binding protein [Aurantivibrio plasticivorans]
MTEASESTNTVPANPLIDAKHISRVYPPGVAAVSDVSLMIREGETLALVGESGCGKSTLGRILALLDKPTEGDLSIAGDDVVALNRKQLKPLRREVQMIFQDPVGSLNPRHTVEGILTEPMKIHALYDVKQQDIEAIKLLESVGLGEEDLKKYPHEFSGGQRQRIAIARALVLNPRFIVADEPVSALDVSVQSQILNLLVELREKFALTYLFISHDMAVVHHIADRVAVMYLGRIVEVASRDQLFGKPEHPYTRALLASVPRMTYKKTPMGQVLHGDPPSPLHPPSGCAFHPRCPHAQPICRQQCPNLEAIDGSQNQLVACHFRGEIE